MLKCDIRHQNDVSAVESTVCVSAIVEIIIYVRNIGKAPEPDGPDQAEKYKFEERLHETRSTD